MLHKPRRNVNRLLVLCTSINDVTVWPFWKFLQMKKLKGITDMAFLAFNSHGGSFEAAIAGTTYKLKNYVHVTGYKQDMLEDFLHRWHDPGRSYFVYGGHGMGDYLEFETDKVALQAHELARIMGHRRFEAMVFDACFMANLDCAYHLRHNTRYIGACEGYMWEPDTELDLHVLNTHNASVMTRFRNPLHILQTIQKDYCARCPRGDFAILDTTHVAALREFVQRRVIQRVYDRAALYTGVQHSYLCAHATRMMQAVNTRYGLAGQPGETNSNSGTIALPPLQPPIASQPHSSLPLLPATRLTRETSDAASTIALPTTSTTTSNTPVLQRNTLSHTHTVVQPWSSTALPARLTRRQRIERAIQFEHALYPSELRDKHLVDLKSYLIDLAIEEAAREESGESVMPTRLPSTTSSTTGSSQRATRSTSSQKTRVGVAASQMKRSMPSTAMCVQAHAALPPRPHIPLSPPLPLSQQNIKEKGDTSGNGASCKGVTGEIDNKISPFPPDSAHYGLDLFHKVVLQHTAPRAAQLYSARLHGLSLSVHEFSALSKPVEPWLVERRTLKKRCKEFLQCGALSEVRMRDKVPTVTGNLVTPTASVQATSHHRDVQQDKRVVTKEATVGDVEHCSSVAAPVAGSESVQAPVKRESAVQSS